MRETEKQVLKAAWKARKYAYPWKSGIKVGCAILTTKGDIITGWNIEGLWMTSLHAEVVAISQLRRTESEILLIAIVAKTKMFTPCGGCLDWIHQFSKNQTKVIIDNEKETKTFSLSELMPYYPIQ